jgi:hypothetical protein
MKKKSSPNNEMAINVEALDYFQKELQEIPNNNPKIKKHLTNGEKDSMDSIIQLAKKATEEKKLK